METFSLIGFTPSTCSQQYSSLYMRSACAVKISETETRVVVAISKSKYEETVSFLRNFHAPKEVVVQVVSDGEFAEFIGGVLDGFHREVEIQPDVSDFSLERISSSSAAVNIINAICLEALRRNASDIHLEPSASEMRIRFRIDGVLLTVKKLDKSLFVTIASRIKIMSGLNIMEQRLPQDGRMRVVADGKPLDFRVSTVPVSFGESIVLRIFNTRGDITRLDDLGFSADTHEKLKKSIGIANGLILATGPTGSGKTTTLHSLLCAMDRESLKIITIEDPVERILPDVNQIQVHDEIAVSFDTMLRRVLRQDPNVIMIGEIRDNATAELALRAALTGHIILSTLHTNDSVSAITRLQNMGLEPYLIASVLRFVLAQRLVRRLCPFCAQMVTAPIELETLFKKHGIVAKEIAVEKGCEKCEFTGFRGRVAVAEMFEADDSVESLIIAGKSAAEIRRNAIRNGMVTLEADALAKIAAGITSLSETRREALL